MKEKKKFTDLGEKTRTSEPPDRSIGLIITLELFDQFQFLVVALVFLSSEVNQLLQGVVRLLVLQNHLIDQPRVNKRRVSVTRRARDLSVSDQISRDHGDVFGHLFADRSERRGRTTDFRRTVQRRRRITLAENVDVQHLLEIFDSRENARGVSSRQNEENAFVRDTVDESNTIVGIVEHLQVIDQHSESFLLFFFQRRRVQIDQGEILHVALLASTALCRRFRTFDLLF